MPPYDTNREPILSRLRRDTTLTKPTPATWLYTGIGALLGLLLGLLIAWVIWPVQWTDAWPADLSQEARAQYLAAVSEAYVYYGDEQAAAVARNRLFNLNEDLGAAIADAQAFFADNPQANSRVYISNLGQLAQALNVQSPDIIIDTPVDAAPAAVVPPVEEAAVGDSVRAWVNWALTVLAAIVLVGGGFYVVGRLNQRRLAGSNGDTLDDDTDGFDDEPGNVGYVRPSPAAGGSGAGNPYTRPIRGVSTGGFATSTTTPTPRSETLPRSEHYAFDDDGDDEHLYSRGETLNSLDYRSEDEIFEEEDDDAATLYAPRRTQEATRELDNYELDDYESSDRQLADRELNDEESLNADLAIAPSTQRTGSRSTGTQRTLNTYTFQYHVGIPDYDQSRPIVDPETGLQVGDCGMGVNMKNNILQSNPDNVIALDVWLVDKKQEKSFSSQDRVLLSEYVVDHNLETAFTRERPNDPSPIIPQPGTTFQIKGPSLTLDCLVTEANYIKEGAAAGMFQSLSIDMTVSSRN
jgi:hypothetical protein